MYVVETVGLGVTARGIPRRSRRPLRTRAGNTSLARCCRVSGGRYLGLHSTTIRLWWPDVVCMGRHPRHRRPDRCSAPDAPEVYTKRLELFLKTPSPLGEGVLMYGLSNEPQGNQHANPEHDAVPHKDAVGMSTNVA